MRGMRVRRTIGVGRTSTRAIFPIVVRRAGMLAVGLVLLWCATARAGTYEVWSCANADGRPVPADGWRSEGYGYFSSPSNDCAGGTGSTPGSTARSPTPPTLRP